MTQIYIRYINFWSGFYTKKTEVDRIIDSAIRYTFFKHSKTYTLVEDTSKTPNIVVSSVFGNPKSLSSFDENTFIIVINGENSYGHDHHYKWAYESLRNNGYRINLYLGFSREEDDVQKRFPLWLWYYDFYLKNESNAYRFIKDNSGTNFTTDDFEKRKLAACMCARSNHFNWRSTFYNTCIQNGIIVKCPSKVCHNDKDIDSRGLSKAQYISGFVFNICPENTVTSGYCTEKLMECVMSGCIPIYWGDFDNEIIFNQNRIIKASSVIKDFPKLAQQVKYLLSNKDSLIEFFQQPLFTDNAIHVIDSFLDKLDSIPKMYDAFSRVSNKQ